jgi:hypothetical protein
MTTTREFEHEVIFQETEYSLIISVTADLIDESFDHAFGTESASGVEVIDLEIDEAHDNTNDKEVKNKRLKAKLLKEIDFQEFADRFDYDEFE